MRIAVDAISAGEGLGLAAGGMIVYYRGLLPALADRTEVDEVLVLTQPWADAAALRPHPKVSTVRCRGLPRNRVGRVTYEQTALPATAARHKPDVLLSTHNTAPLLRRAPTVVVLQSVQYLFYPESFGRSRRAYLRSVVPLSLRKAHAVIAVSEWERQAAIRAFGVDPSRIFTVHHGVSDLVNKALATRPADSPAAARPYVVMVSTLYGFKNHARLIRAFAKVVAARSIPHELVIAGGDADVTRAELADVAAREKIGARVRLLGPIAHDDIPTLLARADAIAYTSLFETFGLPVLEALAVGRPLVTSNVTAMPEVAGDAAVLVDPRDTDSIAAGLAAALLDEPLRDRLRAAGPRRASGFTWEACADGTLRALRHAMSHSR